MEWLLNCILISLSIYEINGRSQGLRRHNICEDVPVNTLKIFEDSDVCGKFIACIGHTAVHYKCFNNAVFGSAISDCIQCNETVINYYEDHETRKSTKSKPAKSKKFIKPTRKPKGNSNKANDKSKNKFPNSSENEIVPNDLISNNEEDIHDEETSNNSVSYDNLIDSDDSSDETFESVESSTVNDFHEINYDNLPPEEPITNIPEQSDNSFQIFNQTSQPFHEPNSVSLSDYDTQDDSTVIDDSSYTTSIQFAPRFDHSHLDTLHDNSNIENENDFTTFEPQNSSTYTNSSDNSINTSHSEIPKTSFDSDITSKITITKDGENIDSTTIKIEDDLHYETSETAIKPTTENNENVDGSINKNQENIEENTTKILNDEFESTTCTTAIHPSSDSSTLQDISKNIHSTTIHEDISKEEENENKFNTEDFIDKNEILRNDEDSTTQTTHPQNHFDSNNNSELPSTTIKTNGFEEKFIDPRIFSNEENETTDSETSKEPFISKSNSRSNENDTTKESTTEEIESNTADTDGTCFTFPDYGGNR